MMETKNKLFPFSSQSLYVNLFYFVCWLALAGEYKVSTLYFAVQSHDEEIVITHEVITIFY